LIGMTSYTVIQRTKEIGIRKTLGASLIHLLSILSRETLRLIVISGLIAVPISFFILKSWLANFSFQVEITWWFFVAPIMLILLLSFLSVIYKIVKCALTNPVNSLRYE